MKKLFAGFGKLAATTVIAASFISTASAEIVMQDDFESGELGNQYTKKQAVTVQDIDIGGSGMSKVARFFFKGTSAGGDAFSELRFNLGQNYEELSISFDLYVPSNYDHRADNPSNNKFFRLWPLDYNHKEKIGGSTKPAGNGSGLGVDYSRGPTAGISTGVGGVTADFFGDSDKGKWMKVIIDVRASKGSQDGFIRYVKNGQEFMMHSMNTDYDPSQTGYQHGYLLGWANSGFDEDTIFYMDNLVIKDQVSAAPMAPEDVIVQ